jgi:preprotein translocase subunit SecE
VTQTRAGEPGGNDEAASTSPARRGDAATVERLGPFARLRRFMRQVVSELKKVVRPTRQELLTYTSVVLVFVLAVMVFVSGLDFSFGKLVKWAFAG